MTTIAIIGTGPTGVYAFKALVAEQPGSPLRVWLFEKGDEAGVGMPYSDETANRMMLANIASIEIPPVTRPYLDWLRDQPEGLLRRHGVDPDDMDDRDFTPRLLLGTYYRDEFDTLVTRARAAGHQIEIREKTEITDIRTHPEGGLTLITDAGPVEAVFDKVVIATGHVFPEDPEGRRFFPSPWSGLLDTAIPAGRVGILGTSLSAIDAAMAVVSQHGRFIQRRGAPLAFQTEAEGLSICMMSRSGVLPEADFYCQIPYRPLSIMTESALAEAVGKPGLLDTVFDLFRAELTAADPDYAAAIDLASATADNIAARYFRDRKAADPFDWARANLAEVEANKAAQHTVEWRYAILRMHEPVETIVEHLDEGDRARFDRGLKAVFVDNYAAVPPESIRRLLALRDAGLLSVENIGADWKMTREGARTIITAEGARHVFDVFIDARGQKPLEASDLPFPTLRKTLVARGTEVLDVDEDYALANARDYDGRVYMAAIPYLMHDRPFVQGITAAEEIGRHIGQALRAEATQRARRLRRRGLRE